MLICCYDVFHILFTILFHLLQLSVHVIREVLFLYFNFSWYLIREVWLLLWCFNFPFYLLQPSVLVRWWQLKKEVWMLLRCFNFPFYLLQPSVLVRWWLLIKEALTVTGLRWRQPPSLMTAGSTAGDAVVNISLKTLVISSISSSIVNHAGTGPDALSGSARSVVMLPWSQGVGVFTLEHLSSCWSWKLR